MKDTKEPSEQLFPGFASVTSPIITILFQYKSTSVAPEFLLLTSIFVVSD